MSFRVDLWCTIKYCRRCPCRCLCSWLPMLCYCLLYSFCFTKLITGCKSQGPKINESKTDYNALFAIKERVRQCCASCIWGGICTKHNQSSKMYFVVNWAFAWPERQIRSSNNELLQTNLIFSMYQHNFAKYGILTNDKI